jgi:hypothetical protein
MSLTRKNKVCVLTAMEAEDTKLTGFIPPCKCHRHMSRKKAEEVTRNFLYSDGNNRHFDAYWVDRRTKKAIYFNTSREWKPSYSGGYTVLQLISGGGVR